MPEKEDPNARNPLDQERQSIIDEIHEFRDKAQKIAERLAALNKTVASIEALSRKPAE